MNKKDCNRILRSLESLDEHMLALVTRHVVVSYPDFRLFVMDGKIIYENRETYQLQYLNTSDPDRFLSAVIRYGNREFFYKPSLEDITFLLQEWVWINHEIGENIHFGEKTFVQDDIHTCPARRTTIMAIENNDIILIFNKNLTEKDAQNRFKFNPETILSIAGFIYDDLHPILQEENIQ